MHLILRSTIDPSLNLKQVTLVLLVALARQFKMLKNVNNRLPVNSSHGQLVTGQLVSRSTRHKEAVNSSQANKQASIKALLPQQFNYPIPTVRDRRLYEKMQKKLSRKQSEQQSTRSVLLTARLHDIV